MSDNTKKAVILLSAAFGFLIFVFLLLLSPVVALLYLAVLLLAGTIIWFRSDSVRRIFLRDLNDKRDRIRQKRETKQTGTQPLDTSFHVSYQLVSRRGAEKRTPIDKEDFLIGRSTKCDLQMHGNPSVSAEHCRIVYRKFSHEYYIEDLNSDGGTYVGARRLEPYKQEKLLPNMEVTIAGWTYRFAPIGG